MRIATLVICGFGIGGCSSDALADVPAGPEWEFIFSLEVSDDWTIVNGDDDFAIFATKVNARRDGDRVTISQRWEYTQPLRESGALSTRPRVEYDCTARKSRLISVVYFEKNNLAGNILSSDTTKHEQWDAVVPGTRGEAMMEWACTNVQAEGPTFR